MANLAAIIANRGYYYTPHLVKKIGKDGYKRPEYLKKNYSMAAAKHFEPVVNAMEMVVENGTARGAQIDSIIVCGKTGTVQNETFNDHSVFIAFAPRENPQIAIAVYVEYGTWGGVWAAKIASLMIEQYLQKELSEKGKKKEQEVLDAIILDKHSDFK
jgi:penicillin-binding protein 2